MPGKAGDDTSLATNPCVASSIPSTPYTYIEPRLASQAALDVHVGTSSGHVVLAGDGNDAIYMVNQQNTTAQPHAQVLYKSVDQGTSWDQRGSVPLRPGQCAESLGVSPQAFGSGSAHRLVLAIIACNGTGTTPCVGISFTSDDGGSSWVQAGNCTQPFATDYCSCTLAADDVGAMHLVYSANGASNPNALLHNLTSDGGVTWSNNVQIAAVPRLPRWPSMAATGPVGGHQMTVVFEQTQSDNEGRWQIGSVVSNDNGATWSAPGDAIKPSGNEMMSAPAFAALDAHTVAATYFHVVGDHNTEISKDIGMAFGQVQDGNAPVFGSRLSLGTIATFPPTIVVLPNNMLLVATQTAAADGPFFTRLTLSR